MSNRRTSFGAQGCFEVVARSLAVDEHVHERAELAARVEQQIGDRQLAQSVERPFRPRRVSPLLLRAVALTGEAAWRLGRRPMLDLARFAELHADGFVCSVERARALIGFTAETSLAEGFEQTVRWYRARGWI